MLGSIWKTCFILAVNPVSFSTHQVKAETFLVDLNDEGCTDGAKITLPVIGNNLSRQVLVEGDGRQFGGGLDCTVALEVSRKSLRLKIRFYFCS